MPATNSAGPSQWYGAASQWLTLHWWEIVVAISAGIVIYLVLATLRRLASRLHNRPGRSITAVDIVGRVLARTSHLFMIMVAARLVVGYANPPSTVYGTVAFLFTVAAALQAAIWVREIVISIIEARANEDENSDSLRNAMGVIRVLVSVAVFAVALLVVLDNLGVNVTALVAGLGVGGIAIGLAAQGIFSDLFAALSILFDKPFKQGDTIAYDTTVATVQKIGLKSTRLQSVDGERKIIANTNLLDKEITSYARLDRRRVTFAIGVIYQTSPDVAEAIPERLKALITDHGAEFIRCGFVGFGASSLDYELVFDVFDDDWDRIFVLRHRVGIAILRLFNEEGIEFAYPTQTTFTSAPDGTMIMPYPENWVAPENRQD